MILLFGKTGQVATELQRSGDVLALGRDQANLSDPVACAQRIRALAPRAVIVAGIVEKPNFEEAPSDIASIGRYILTPDIFDVLRDLPAGSGGEIQLADAINNSSPAGQRERRTLNGTAL